MEGPVLVNFMECETPEIIERDLIVDELQKVLASETFTRSQRMSRFLRFTVGQSLEGRGDRLKEYLIGVEVYDKPESLDPRFDPIVRVEAGRLRAKLREYYETDGRYDRVVISYPKRSYAPQFHRNQGTIGPTIPDQGRPQDPSRSIAVLPFLDMSQNYGLQNFCDGLTEEVNTALGSIDGLRVAARSSVQRFKDCPADVRRIGRELNTGMVIEGSVRGCGSRLRVTFQLNSCADGYHIWCETRESRVQDVWAFQGEISSAIAARVRNSLAPTRWHPTSAFAWTQGASARA